MTVKEKCPPNKSQECSAGYSKNSPETIQKMFDSIARSYDKTNAVLSFQMHKHWNRTLIAQALTAVKPKVFLDLCCGTGAIGLGYLVKNQQSTKAYLLDFSPEMLVCAKAQAKKLQISQHELEFIQADAQNIPLNNNSIDSASIAYGLRNIKNPSQCIQEVSRVLVSGGTFGILELTQPENKIMRWGHKLYLRSILPLIGKLMTSNQEAYQYLCGSIHAFIPPKEIEALLKANGFGAIQRKSFFGGVATLFIAKKL